MCVCVVCCHQSYAAIPCEACAVTDAGAYFEALVQRPTQLAFVTAEQLKQLRDKCETPQVSSSTSRGRRESSCGVALLRCW